MMSDLCSMGVCFTSYQAWFVTVQGWWTLNTFEALTCLAVWHAVHPVNLKQHTFWFACSFCELTRIFVLHKKCIPVAQMECCGSVMLPTAMVMIPAEFVYYFNVYLECKLFWRKVFHNPCKYCTVYTVYYC